MRFSSTSSIVFVVPLINKAMLINVSELLMKHLGRSCFLHISIQTTKGMAVEFDGLSSLVRLFLSSVPICDFSVTAKSKELFLSAILSCLPVDILTIFAEGNDQGTVDDMVENITIVLQASLL